jgi:hypothetical protein
VTDQNNQALRQITPAGVVTTPAVASGFASVTGIPLRAGALVLAIARSVQHRVRRDTPRVH